MTNLASSSSRSYDLCTEDGRERLSLVRLSPDDGEEVYEMLQHIAANENEFKNEVYGMDPSKWQGWLSQQDAWSRGESLPDGYVPQTTYWLFADGVPVGYGKIRSCLTEASRHSGGNIGYAIDSRYRGRGYGTTLMSLLISEARASGVKELLMTVEEGNIASRRALEKCGARLIDHSGGVYFFTA